MLDEQATRDADDARRGREAETPTDIPKQGWKDIVRRAWAHSGEDNLGLAAGGVTYYVLLALFPGLAALVSIYGLFSSPAQVQSQVAALAGVMPAQAQSLIATELKQISSSSGGALSFGAVIGFLFALYSASRGVGGLMTGLNIAYEEKERRSLLWQYLTALGLTIMLIAAGLVAIGFIAGAPAVINAIGLGAFGRWLIYILEWPVLMAFLLLILAVAYRVGPSRDHPQWAWITPGALTATVLWLVGSIVLHGVRLEFRQLQQDLRLARRDHRAADLDVSVRLRRAARGGDRRASGTADPSRHDRRTSEADGRARRRGGRHAR